MRDLCVTDEGRAEVDRMIKEWNYEIYIPLDLEAEFFGIRIAQYQLKSLNSLKEKLLQFPKGTAFKLNTASTGRDDSDADEVFKHAKTFLEEHGIKLQRSPGNKDSRHSW